MRRNISMIISIDGPAASGKSTTAQLLSEKLDYIHLNSGLLYRAVTYIFLKNKLFGNDNFSVKDFFLNNNINLEGRKLNKAVWNNTDITKYLYEEDINKNINIISRNSYIRQCLVSKQRKLSLGKNIVCEGRDIGTVVFPDADFKFYLNASLNSRVSRRYEEFTNSNINTSKNEIKLNLIIRDHNDINRKISPLVQAEDATEIDTTNMSIDEQVTVIYNKIKQGTMND